MRDEVKKIQLDEAVRLNRESWDKKALVHGDDRYYDIAGFLAGESSLRETELSLCGEVEGLDLLHLQCHFGLDTLSWARLGARATGLDFSPVAISKARRLAIQAGLSTDFVEADIHNSLVNLTNRFDLVIATYGVFCWVGDLERWANLAMSALRPGGKLVVVDAHPILRMFEAGQPPAANFPFADDGPHRFSSSGTYADPRIVMASQDNVQWAHSLGEIVSAICLSGMRLQRLSEHMSSDRNDRPGVLSLSHDNRWCLRILAQDLPVLFSLVCVKT